MARGSGKNPIWSGRFEKSPDEAAISYNASIGFDKRLYRHDIDLSIAHARALNRIGVLTDRERSKIIDGLKKVKETIASGRADLSDRVEDIHMAIEIALRREIGPLAGKLHTGRSRNDQVATTARLYTRDEIDALIGQLLAMRKALLARAAESVEILAPAHTHLQPAQPIRLAHWFLAYYEMFTRDRSRLLQTRSRLNVSPLGSAALAGSNYPLDRDFLARELGFDGITRNSLDGVSDRDFVAETLFDLSLIGIHLSRLSEDLIFYMSAEVGSMALDESYCSGSSIMPQKRNPDIPELARGKSARLIGNLVAMLTVLKGLPLSYNKDLQEDKEALFDSIDQVKATLDIFPRLIMGLQINAELLAARAEKYQMTAVDIADRLALSGVPFREAHHIVGRLSRAALEKGADSFRDLDADFARAVDERLGSIWGSGFDAAASVEGKDIVGGVARRRVRSQIARLRRTLKSEGG